jgi:hypothetical protein
MRLAGPATVAALSVTVVTLPAYGADLFTVTVTSNGQTGTAGFNSAEQAIDEFKNGELTTLLPSYTTSSIASGTIDYRGLLVTASYPTSGTTLHFQVPSLGIDQTFTGSDRNASQQDLLNYLKTGNEYGNIEHALAAVSPADPVAGNPGSLQSTMSISGFNAAFSTAPGSTGTSVSTSHAAGAAPGGQPNAIGIGAEFGHFTESNTNINAITIPLSYNFGVGADDKYRIGIELPLTYIDTQGAKSGAASLGLDLTVPVTKYFSLTPRVAAGVTGSLDLASAAALWSSSVTSAFHFGYNGYGFVIGDMLGYSKSLNVSIGSYSVDPRIGDAFTKNGAMIAIPTEKFGLEIPFLPQSDLQLFVTDTRFWGTKLYEMSLQEVGFSFGSSALQVIGQDIRVGATYVHGQHSNGFIANFGFAF